MRFTLNGEHRDFSQLAQGTTLEQFIQHLELHPGRIAVEHNGDIIPKTQWPLTVLSDGDKLEVVHFVGGGCC
jgi:sulfur carrier protein